MFEEKGFDVDFPKNDANSEADWTAYRLSLSHMQSLADHSTHLRATCDYPTDGLKYTDYARAKLAGHDIFGTFSDQCRDYEYINIRGLSEMSATTAPPPRNRKEGVPGQSTATKVKSSSVATLTELPVQMATRTTLGTIETALSTPHIAARPRLALQLSTGLERCITCKDLQDNS